MFNELKQVKYFKEITDFKRLYNVKYFKEIKRLKSLQKPEAYLKPKVASTMGHFFLKNHIKNMLEKLFPDPNLKKSKLSIYLDQ